MPKVADQHPPRGKFLVRRTVTGPFVATPCYGMHTPWWVPLLADLYAPGDLMFPMEPADEWEPWTPSAADLHPGPGWLVAAPTGLSGLCDDCAANGTWPVYRRKPCPRCNVVQATANQVRRETASAIRDVARRIGPGCTQEWIRAEIDRIASRLEFHAALPPVATMKESLG